MIKVSVIVPAYNAEKTLDECLDSLLHQDYEDYEVIVVDDGSTDNTRGVAESHRDEKLVYIRQSNGGVSAARNTGISRARGEYIAFCDADDCVSACYVRTMMENADGDALVICASTRTRSALDTKDMETPSMKFDYLLSSENFAQLLNRFYVNAVWSKLFKKSVIQEHNFQFDRDVCFAEDTRFVYNYLYIVRKIVYVNHILYFYNTQNSVLTKSVNEWKVLSFLVLLDFLSESFAQGKLVGDSVISHWTTWIVADCAYMSVSLYACLPSSEAHTLRIKIRSHPFVRSCIENCPWECMNDYVGRAALINFFAKLNNELIWRLAGRLKRWNNGAIWRLLGRLTGRTQKK